jgi:predicted aconitase with swiveling domain
VSELRLTEPLSFWGGLDPETGKIVDRHHPQFGESIAGRSLIMARTRGSTSSPGTLIEAIRLGNGPADITLQQPDLTVMAAVKMAKLLYSIEVDVQIDNDH